jgi:hypothetical protein
MIRLALLLALALFSCGCVHRRCTDLSHGPGFREQLCVTTSPIPSDKYPAQHHP